MNRAYKVIYNKKRRLVQVVSEISGGFTRAERQGRRSLLRGLVLSCLVGASLIAAPLPSYAATTEEQVAANSAAIAQNKTNIAANKTAIESNQSGIRAVTRTVEAQQASISGKAEQTDLNKETAERKDPPCIVHYDLNRFRAFDHMVVRHHIYGIFGQRKAAAHRPFRHNAHHALTRVQHRLRHIRRGKRAHAQRRRQQHCAQNGPQPPASPFFQHHSSPASSALVSLHHIS